MYIFFPIRNSSDVDSYVFQCASVTLRASNVPICYGRPASTGLQGLSEVVSLVHFEEEEDSCIQRAKVELIKLNGACMRFA